MVIKAKAVKVMVKEAGRQINKGGLEVLNRGVQDYLTGVLGKQTSKRITEKTIVL